MRRVLLGDQATPGPHRTAKGTVPASHPAQAVHVHLAEAAGLSIPDVYFSAGYGHADSWASGGDWVLIEAFDGRWQMPLHLRSVDGGGRDAASPYGYSGVYAHPELTERDVHAAWTATQAALRDLGAISVVLRHSPLVPQAPLLPEHQIVVSGHPTRLVEIPDEETAWSAMEGRSRTAVRKATKSGLVAIVRRADTTDVLGSGSFRLLYSDTMRRRGAAPAYHFGDDYYSALLDGLGDNLLTAEVRGDGGFVLAAALLLQHQDRLHYHLSGSAAGAVRTGCTNLLLWEAIRFAARVGLHEFHLGGGIARDDSLYQFKRSFGGREVEYRMSGLVLDERTYHQRVRARAAILGVTEDALLQFGFFPAYRAEMP